MSDMPALLRMENIDKRFTGVAALTKAHLEIARGEVHALVGQNGAGKSTLIKIMTGLQQQDSGEIRIDGQPVRVTSSQDAQRLGVAAINVGKIGAQAAGALMAERQ